MNKLLPARKLGEYTPERRGYAPYRPVRQQQHQRETATESTLAFSGEAMLFSALVLLLIIMGVGLIGMYGKVVAINYELQQTNREIGKVMEESEYLSIEVRKLSSLERIEHIAITELGLQYPEERQWLLLSARQSVTRNTR